MVISEDILFEHGALVRSYSENEFIFSEGSSAKNYLQIQDGTIKISNTFDDGKEFVQELPFKGHCFGESYLHTNEPFGINAIALTSCSVISLKKSFYFNMIEKRPEIMLDVNRYKAEHLHFRYLVSSFLAIRDPLIKVQRLLAYLKNYLGYTGQESFQLPYTRYQLASLTGLRVETIIRVIKKMQTLQMLKIEHGKIYY